MHLLEQIQSYIERTSLGWGSSEITTQVQGHRQGHPVSHQGQIILRSFNVISRSNLKIARKDM